MEHQAGRKSPITSGGYNALVLKNLRRFLDRTGRGAVSFRSGSPDYGALLRRYYVQALLMARARAS